MSQGYQIKDQNAAYYLTLQIVHWADIFTRKIYRDIVIESMRYCQLNKGLEIYAYVIMSNHIHLLVRSSNGNLSDIIRDFKRHTSKRIIEAVQQKEESRREWLLMVFRYASRKHKRNNNYQVWTHENRAIEVYSNKFIEQKVDYIHNNPVVAGIVATDAKATAPQYNGNISAVTWTDNNNNQYEYDYYYDQMNRLTQAQYLSSQHSLDAYAIPEIKYDANGNIKELTRMGLDAVSDITDIDNLDYAYTGNQLTQVKDSGDIDLGFIDYENAVDYPR